MRDDGRLRQGRRPVRERPGARRDPRPTSPGTHYLGSAHTLANFETAFYRSDVADNNSFEQWQEDGSLDAAQRANAHLEADAAPSTRRRRSTPAIDEALLDFIARRKASMPDSEV